MHNTYSKQYYLFFIFSILLIPISSFVFLLYSKNKKLTNFLIVFLCVWFGLNFSFSNPDFDSYRYGNTIYFYQNMPFDEFFNYHIFKYMKYIDNMDFLSQTISYFSSKLIPSNVFLFTVYSFFSGIILVSIKDKALKDVEINHNAYLIVFFIFLVFFPIFNINGVRYYLASIVFINGMFCFLRNEIKIAFIYFLLSLLTHFSFIYFIGFLLLFMSFKLLNRMTMIYLILFGFFLSGIALPYMSKVSESLNNSSSISKVAQNYSNEDYVDNLKEEKKQANIIISITNKLMFYSTIAIYLYVTFFLFNIIKDDYYIYNIWYLSGGVTFFSVVVHSLPSVARFTFVSEFLSFFILVYILNFKGKSFINSNFLYMFVFALILMLQVIVNFRMGLEVLGVNILTPVPFMIFNCDVNQSIYSLLF